MSMVATIVGTCVAFVVLAVIAAIVMRRARDRRLDDMTWRSELRKHRHGMTPPVAKFKGYDQVKAVAGREKWMRQTSTGRELPPPEAAERRRSSGGPTIVHLDERRRAGGGE
jgi:hypothetical protein